MTPLAALLVAPFFEFVAQYHPVVDSRRSGLD